MDEIVEALLYSSKKYQIRFKLFALFFIRDTGMDLKKWNPSQKTDIEIWIWGMDVIGRG